MDEKDLEQRIRSLQNLAEQNQNVDLPSLMLSTLEHQQDDNYVSDKDKTKAYLWSFFMPPIAVYYFFRFFFGDKDDGRRIAVITLLIAILTTLLGLVGTKLMLNSAGLGNQSLSGFSSQLFGALR